MRSIESEGDTIDQAIENALRALNVTRDRVEIEILTGATRGLLGFGGKKARVRATVRAPLLSRLHGLENEVADMDSRETLPPVENDEPAHRQVRDTRTQPPPEAASHAAAPSGRVMIDVERYRERRLEHLTQLARRLAEKAKQTGRPVTLNPMSARDRRVVHVTLQGDTAISTRSQGEGHYRKVIILPADRTRRPPRPKPPAS